MQVVTPKGVFRDTITAVDMFPYANGFGLVDVHGNVFEWCQDEWHGNYEGALTNGSAWEEILSRSNYRMLRGGSWDLNPWVCRSAFHDYVDPHDRDFTIGFRVVKE